MTTQPAPVPEGYISPDMLPPQDRAYVDRLRRALRCGVLGCSCANPGRFHCPSHDNPEVPTLTVSYNPDSGSFSFECTRCPYGKVLDALARRGLTPESELYTILGRAGSRARPLRLLHPATAGLALAQPHPLGKLTLIAGYPSSGKTSIVLDIAARVSRGAAVPDQPDAPFPSAPVVLAPLTAIRRPASCPR